MFDTLPISNLAAMLDHFSFPMLIAERPDPTTEFRAVAINGALEDITGPRDAVCGMTLRDVFPPAVVDDVISAFNPAGTLVDQQEFNTVIRGIAGDVPCKLTLQYIRCHDGFDRVLATAQQSRGQDLDLQDKLAFEDVRYFSFVADLQLENLNCAFVSAAESISVSPVDEERIMRLHAACRTIQRTVSDIKNVVRKAQLRHAAKGPSNIVRTRSDINLPTLNDATHMFRALDPTEETDVIRAAR